METVIKQMKVEEKDAFKVLQSRIAFFLVLFFLTFGAASLYLLLNSPA